MSDWYTIDAEHNVTPCEGYPREPVPNELKRVARTDFESGVWVSTVFLQLDHSFDGGAPVLFETMVFGAPDNFSDLYCRRYHTWEQAAAGHEEVVELVERYEAEGRDLGKLYSHE